MDVVGWRSGFRLAPRGNLPQAFVHALLLECAAQVGRELSEGD